MVKKNRYTITDEEIYAARTDPKALERFIIKSNFMIWWVVNMYYQPDHKNGVHEKGDLYATCVERFIWCVHNWDKSRHSKFYTYAIGTMRGRVSQFLRSTNGIVRTLNPRLDVELPKGIDVPHGEMAFDNPIEREIQETCDSNTAQQSMDAMDRDTIIRQSMTCLKPLERELITLRYGLGDKAPMSPRVIAEYYGISTPSASRRLTAARIKMREYIKRHGLNA